MLAGNYAIGSDKENRNDDNGSTEVESKSVDAACSANEQESTSNNAIGDTNVQTPRIFVESVHPTNASEESSVHTTTTTTRRTRSTARTPTATPSPSVRPYAPRRSSTPMLTVEIVHIRVNKWVKRHARRMRYIRKYGPLKPSKFIFLNDPINNPDYETDRTDR